LNETITPVLEKRPEDAQWVLNSVETVAGELGRKEPNKSFLNLTIEGLKCAATVVKDIAPSVLDVTEKIFAFVTRITGGA
jgi:hypothetical protein